MDSSRDYWKKTTLMALLWKLWIAPSWASETGWRHQGRDSGSNREIGCGCIPLTHGYIIHFTGLGWGGKIYRKPMGFGPFKSKSLEFSRVFLKQNAGAKFWDHVWRSPTRIPNWRMAVSDSARRLAKPSMRPRPPMACQVSLTLW